MPAQEKRRLSSFRSSQKKRKKTLRTCMKMGEQLATLMAKVGGQRPPGNHAPHASCQGKQDARKDRNAATMHEESAPHVRIQGQQARASLTEVWTSVNDPASHEDALSLNASEMVRIRRLSSQIGGLLGDTLRRCTMPVWTVYGGRREGTALEAVDCHFPVPLIMKTCQTRAGTCHPLNSKQHAAARRRCVRVRGKWR